MYSVAVRPYGHIGTYIWYLSMWGGGFVGSKWRGATASVRRNVYGVHGRPRPALVPQRNAQGIYGQGS